MTKIQELILFTAIAQEELAKQNYGNVKHELGRIASVITDLQFELLKSELVPAVEKPAKPHEASVEKSGSLVTEIVTRITDAEYEVENDTLDPGQESDTSTKPIKQPASSIPKPEREARVIKKHVRSHGGHNKKVVPQDVILGALRSSENVHQASSKIPGVGIQWLGNYMRKHPELKTEIGKGLNSAKPEAPKKAIKIQVRRMTTQLITAALRSSKNFSQAVTKLDCSPGTLSYHLNKHPELRTEIGKDLQKAAPEKVTPVQEIRRAAASPEKPAEQKPAAQDPGQAEKKLDPKAQPQFISDNMIVATLKDKKGHLPETAFALGMKVEKLRERASKSSRLQIELRKWM